MESSCERRERQYHVAAATVRRTYVVRSVGMVVHAAEESSRSVLANILDDEVAATGVLIHEVGDVVDETGNEDEWPLRRLLLDCNGRQRLMTDIAKMRTYSLPSR